MGKPAWKTVPKIWEKRGKPCILKVKPLDPKTGGNTYGDRNLKLKLLGYASYRDYLDSQLWQRIRQRALERYGGQCRLCDKPAAHIHHLGYGREVLQGNNLKPLVPLCRDCHTKVEFTTQGRKRTLKESHGAYIRLWKHVKYRKKRDPELRKILPGRCRQCGYKLRKTNQTCRKCEKDGDLGL